DDSPALGPGEAQVDVMVGSPGGGVHADVEVLPRTRIDAETPLFIGAAEGGGAANTGAANTLDADDDHAGVRRRFARVLVNEAAFKLLGRRQRPGDFPGLFSGAGFQG